MLLLHSSWLKNAAALFPVDEPYTLVPLAVFLELQWSPTHIGGV